MKKILLCLLLFSCKTTKQYNFKNIKAAKDEDIIKAINNTKIRIRKNDSLYLILFLLLFTPLSMWAQTCPTIVQEVLTIDESIAVIDNGFVVINDGQTVEMPCPKIAVLYPNPCRDNFQVKGLDKENVKGVIYSIGGQLLSFVDIDKEVDVGYLAQGLYILKVRDSSLVFKFIKQ